MHFTAECGKIELVEKIRKLAVKKVTTEEIKNKLLLATEDKGRTVWHVAAECGK